MTATQDGVSAAGDHSLTTHDSTGQAPSSLAQPSSSAGLAPTTTTAVAAAGTPTPPEKQQQTDEGEKEKTATLTIATPTGKRRREGREVSDGAHTASSTTERPSSPRSAHTSPKRVKTSFFTKIARICMSCTSHSGREHEIDVDEGATRPVTGQEQPKKDAEKQPPTRESSASTTVIPPPTHSLPLVLPDELSDADVIVPPAPSRLLPVSETDGLTSGAVQPPGSTGHDITVEGRPISSRDSGDESESSFTEEDVLRDLIHVDSDAEEQMLIRKGGIGIPLGPDGKPQPLLPPIAPEHRGRKCLVLDLDETLVHSSLRPVPSPDYVVPVEIESFWHNFYVLKRPGVDLFLKKMGEIYEVVVFTASLSKYADPVLDRLDPDRSVAHRLFRESCYNHRGNYVKDLSQLGRPIADTIILDNSPASYIFHPYNAVPISSWFNDPHDTELTDLCPFLADLGSTASDVRGILNSSI